MTGDSMSFAEQDVKSAYAGGAKVGTRGKFYRALTADAALLSAAATSMH
ncbi:hypothetical protein KCP71_13545 [Salmonella enterica subsp. enterica]|nr:hypothetical protein KCP71_13545 [Salmonella enterica subsp. enterica]